MRKELEEVRKIFLADEVDEEERAENEETLSDWERTIVESEMFLDWRSHDVTKQIAQKAKDTYKEMAYLLASDRSLTDEKRRSLWAKQDAALWILSLTEKDAQSTLDQVKKQIEVALGKA